MGTVIAYLLAYNPSIGLAWPQLRFLTLSLELDAEHIDGVVQEVLTRFRPPSLTNVTLHLRTDGSIIEMFEWIDKVDHIRLLQRLGRALLPFLYPKLVFSLDKPIHPSGSGMWIRELAIQLPILRVPGLLSVASDPSKFTIFDTRG